MLPVYQSIIVVNLSDLLVLSDSVISPDVVLSLCLVEPMRFLVAAAACC